MLFNRMVAFYVLIGVTLLSCDYLQKDIPKEKELLEKRLQQVNWKSLTAYPVLTNCDTLAEKEAQKLCLLQTVHDSLQKYLLQESHLQMKEIDTMQMLVSISAKGEWSLQTQPANADFFQMECALLKKLQTIPVKEPAQKEGIPVQIQWQIPIVLAWKN